MSKDGTLPEGTEHRDVDRAFSGVESEDVCECCLDDLTGEQLEMTMCDYCAAKHYRGLYFNLKKKTLNEV